MCFLNVLPLLKKTQKSKKGLIQLILEKAEIDSEINFTYTVKD